MTVKNNIKFDYKNIYIKKKLKPTFLLRKLNKVRVSLATHKVVVNRSETLRVDLCQGTTENNSIKRT